MGAPDSRLKIGLVLDSGLDEPDGVQQYVLDVGEWLRGQGHDVHYLVGSTRRRDITNLHSLGRSINVRFNGNEGSIPLYACRRGIRRLLAAEKFDVLHVQVPHHPLLAQRLIMAADPRTAVVGTFHIAPLNAMVTIGNRLLGVWLRPSLRRFDRMVSVSPAAADFARRTFGMETEVLPNVVDYKRFSAAMPLAGYDDDTLTILTLGRLVPRKGCQTLLDAVALLAGRKDLPKFRVLVCGRGPLEGDLKRFVGHHDLSDIVEFVGFVSEEEKPGYYASADITVFPARGGESFGIVLIEAMAGGRAAVLAGDNPGYRSVMAPRPDLLFSTGRPEALAEKLEYFMKHSAERQKIRDWGATYAKDFDVNTVGSKLLNIYRQALRKRRQA